MLFIFWNFGPNFDFLTYTRVDLYASIYGNQTLEFKLICHIVFWQSRAYKNALRFIQPIHRHDVATQL